MSRRRRRRRPRWVTWDRQRLVAYPWHVQHARNDNWLPWGAGLELELVRMPQSR